MSHDRAFLDNVVTQTLVAEGNARLTPAPPAKQKAESRSDDTRRAAPTKMSYKETRELAQLPGEIEALEQQQHALTARMSSGEYHKQGSEQIKADRQLASEIEQQLAERFARWEALEAKKATL